MLVYDANANSGNTAGFECTYTTFKSDNPAASPENPILVLDNAEKQWDETSFGLFTNPYKKTAFDFQIDGESFTSNILKIDSRFTSLIKWLGENRVKVKLTGANSSEGYNVYKIQEVAFGNGNKLSAEDGFLQFMIERLLASSAPTEATEEEEEEDTDSASNDVGYHEDELDLSDERVGASKRYDRSAFLTGDEVTAEDTEPDETAEEQTESDVEAETEEEQTNIEGEPESEITDEESTSAENPIVSEAAVTEAETSGVTTNTVDLEAVLAQAVAETMDERADGKVQTVEKNDDVVKSEETISTEEDDDVAVQEESEEERTRKDTHKKKSYREKIREAMDDFEDEDDFDSEEDEEDYDDELKKSRKEKKEKHGFFGRKKKKDEDEDDDIEFLDL